MRLASVPPTGPLLSLGGGNPQPTAVGVQSIASAIGWFSGVAVTGEADECLPHGCVANCGSGLGNDSYTFQMNTNVQFTTPVVASLCTGSSNPSGCSGWQQFIYVNTPNLLWTTGVEMEYFLLGYGSNACPNSWQSDNNGNCTKFSQTSNWVLSNRSAADAMQNYWLEGDWVDGGSPSQDQDVAIFSNSTSMIESVEQPSALDIGSKWTSADFNVLGYGNGSTAAFDTGTTATANVATCVSGTCSPGITVGANCSVPSQSDTCETNNLDLVGGCCPTG